MDATSRRWRGIATPSRRRSYGDDVASMAWGVRNLISTQALAPRLERAKSTEDDDEGLGLCRLFCEMGEAYLPMIASERDCNQASIVEVLMACTEFPSRKGQSSTFSVLVPPRESHLEDGGRGPAAEASFSHVFDLCPSRAVMCPTLSANGKRLGWRGQGRR